MSRTALLSDIHGNSPALRTVLADIQHAGCSQVFMLGDLINGVDPQTCVDILREWTEANIIALTCIKGNAEAYLTTPDRSALPRQEEEWNQDMIHLVQWWEDRLSADDLVWLRSFPDSVQWRDACLVHDSPVDRSSLKNMDMPGIEGKYREWFYHAPGIRPDMPEVEWQRLQDLMRAQNFLQVFCGHTHVPFSRELDGRQVCNIGSVGMPLDHDPRASWVLVTEEPNAKLEISIQRVEYDVSLIHQLVDQTPDYYDFKMPGFKDAYKRSFSTGIHWKDHLNS